MGVGHDYRGHVAQLSGVARKAGSRQTEFRRRHVQILPFLSGKLRDSEHDSGKRLSASSVATGAPVIIASGLVSGKATWRIEFPLIVSYESSQGVESTQRLIATVLVCRASTATTPRGVVIQQVVLKRES